MLPRVRNELLVLLGEIEKDRTGLEYRDRLSAADRRVIHDRRHPVVRGDGEELRLELLSRPDVHRHDAIG